VNDPGPRAGSARLVVEAGARPWRDLGAVTWAVLCDLASSAAADAHGWIAPVGAREVGASAGLNKDTAARALAALAAAGIVTRERAEVGIRRRSGYRLHLPAGIGMCPAQPDAVMRPRESDARRRPMAPDRWSRPGKAGAELCPNSSDTSARPAVSDVERPSGSHPHADAPGGGAGAVTEVSGPQRGAEDKGAVPRGGSSGAPAGAVRPLDGHQSLSDGGPRLRGRDRATPAMDEAQGQLFGSAGASSVDPPNPGAQDGQR
jgi:hypothetical protein